MLKPFSWWIFLTIAVILSIICFNTHRNTPHSLWSALSERPFHNIHHPWVLNTTEDYTLRKISYDGFKVHEYNFTISEINAKINGVQRKVLGINGKYPGPLIEAFEGDTLRVRVTNKIPSQKTMLHFHGMTMNQTNFYDGSPTITQCGINSGETFTYEFSATPPGTYWYHGHWETQMIDGLVGPLVVHERNDSFSEKEIREHGNDQVLFLSDLYNSDSQDMLLVFQEPWIGGNIEPIPDIALSQGVQNAKMYFNQQTLIKLHIVNSASYTAFKVALESGSMQVIEVDGTKVVPSNVSRLLIYPAQRYTIIMTGELSQRLFTTPQLNLYEENDNENSFLGSTLKLSSEELYVDLIIGSTRATTDSMGLTQMQLPEYDLVEPYFTPLVNEIVPGAHSTHSVDLSMIRSKTGQMSGAINNKIFRLYDRNSLLSDLLQSTTSSQSEHIGAINTSLTSIFNGSPKERVYHHNHKSPQRKHQSIKPGIYGTSYKDSVPSLFSNILHNSDGIEVIDFVIQNFDDGSHPMHLHGHTMWIMEKGSIGNLARNFTRTFERPLKRDVIWVRSDEWVRVRVVLDNPGLWLLHCHIPWHSMTGMATIVAAQLNQLNMEKAPFDWLALCNVPI